MEIWDQNVRQIEQSQTLNLNIWDAYLQVTLVISL